MSTKSNQEEPRKPTQSSKARFSLNSHRMNPLRIAEVNPPYELTFVFSYDQEDLDEATARFILFSSDDPQTYKRTLTVADDRIQGDEYCTLTYSDLDPNLSYSLLIKRESGMGSYEIFSEMSYTDLKKAEDGDGFLSTEEQDNPEEESEDEEEGSELSEDDELLDDEIEAMYEEQLEMEDMKDL